jgi:hypothetical protein
MTAVWAVVSGVAFLHAFYRAVESTWPATYFALTTGPEYAISRTLPRYILFRTTPVVVTCSFVGAVLANAHQDVVVPVVVTGATHAGFTSLRVAFYNRRPRRPLITVAHLITVAAIIVASLASGLWLAAPLRKHVPPTAEIINTLWTAVIIAVLSAYAVRVGQSRSADQSSIFRSTRAKIPNALWDAVDRLCSEHGADSRLVRAVMLVEATQRPPWFQRVERALARALRKDATLGPLQTMGNPRASDLKLLEQGIAQQFANAHPADPELGQFTTPELRAFAVGYNADAAYGDLLEAAYHYLTYEGSTSNR